MAATLSLWWTPVGFLWADGSAVARSFWVQEFERRHGPLGMAAEYAVCNIEPVVTPPGVTPLRRVPHLEIRPEVVRELGSYLEYHSPDWCRCCGKYTCNLPQYATCVRCGWCKACGHDELCVLQ
jgi:hypothetical protein